MNGENSHRPSRWEAHRNALLLSLAFSSLLFGFAYIPVANAYTFWGSHSYQRNVDDIYTDWAHPGWIKLETTGYSNGQKLDAIEYSWSYGDTTSTFTISKQGSGTTTVSDYERIAWTEFECIEYWWILIVRSETPTLNTQVNYLGGGGFSFYDYTQS